MDKHDVEDNNVSLSTHPGRPSSLSCFFFTVKKNLKESKIRNEDSI